MTTCPTCGQLTDNNDGFVTFVSINGKKQKIVERVELTPFKYVRDEDENGRTRFFDFGSVPVVCVVDREEECNDSIAEDDSLDRVVHSVGDRRLEVVR